MSMPPMTPELWAKTPAGKPSPGVVPNFIDPPSRAPRATAAIVVLLTVMIVILSMRMYSKRRFSRNLGMDDWMALAAGIFTMTMSAVTIAVLNEGGLGPHWWNIPLSDFVNPAFTAKLFTLQLINVWSTGLAKLSILFLLLRLFPRSARRTLAYLVYLGLALNILYSIIITLYYGIVCAPRPGGGGTFPASCSPGLRVHVGISSAALNAFLDIYVLAISIPTIAALQMSTRRKIGVSLVLGTGMLACTCSILTLYYRVVTNPMDDPSWNQVPQIVVGMYEPLIAVITACLPSLPVLWIHIFTESATSFRRLLSRISSSRTRSYQGQVELGPYQPAFEEDKPFALEPAVRSRSSQANSIQ